MILRDPDTGFMPDTRARRPRVRLRRRVLPERGLRGTRSPDETFIGGRGYTIREAFLPTPDADSG